MVEIIDKRRTENVNKKEKGCTLTQETISEQQSFLNNNRFREDLTNNIRE
ncbi:MAG: hypothetical protein O8C66_13370 [Candidatus Methanoperedens sp.]|nr:hypothetical protein [Candidatus Methanoperedens sp.]MCZ7371488.1 hypothetical protein [Candidatus Methanoperedens sp.]